ncbi:hypothetical protein D3C87_1921470 [compost metagenome]
MVAEHAAEQRLLFFEQRDAAVSGDDRRFSCMESGEQGDDKQVAVFKAQRPALTFLLAEHVRQG